MSRQKAKGTRFETAVVNTLRTLLGDREQTIHREVLHGGKDVGDVTGVRIHGMPVVLEVKNHARYQIPEWMDEARVEAGNADAPLWFVVFHRKGLGIDSVESMGRQPVLTDLRTLALFAGHGVIEEEETV